MANRKEKLPYLPQSVRDRISDMASRFGGSVSFEGAKIKVNGDAEIIFRTEEILEDLPRGKPEPMPDWRSYKPRRGRPPKSSRP